ncbi:uncharacterized protein BYT42DRAFT_136013 [Radiomyces spectabilis]|uniref:uncharacterized protein n=1 Tax=Radiomyces spectabilis TaxID=64574 RepID=UPI002220E884|nr:uncharacterized protein BYT42DRAFT_136013 [Radiomyces spectabilis]KAI8367707.1 hypothetical protein BYT42DRAFT_136013 [Radiomyces spectabilis]
MEKYNRQQVAIAGDVQVAATIQFAHAVVRSLLENATLGRRRRSRLSQSILAAINNDVPIVIPSGIILEQESRESVDRIISETRAQIRNSLRYLNPEEGEQVNERDCFKPDVHFVVNQQHLFKLVPVPSCTRKYITITEPILRILLRQARLPSRFTGGNSFEYAFDFTKVRSGSEGFGDLIETDGYGCNVHLFRRRCSHGSSSDLDETDFQEWELEFVRLWGVDPGLSDVFVANDGCNVGTIEGAQQQSVDAPHEIRQMSTVEYYTKAYTSNRTPSS